MDYQDFGEFLDLMDQDETEELISFLKKNIPDKVKWYYFYYYPTMNRTHGASILISNKGDIVYINYYKFMFKGKMIENCFIKRRVEYQDIELVFEEDKHLIPSHFLKKKSIVKLIDDRLLEKHNNSAPSYT